MPAHFIALDSIEKLDQLFTSSHRQPVVIFKHSTSCGISVGVYREIETVNADVNVVVVQRSRNISNEISRRTGIRHESPQAIVISNGTPVYHASHWDIEPMKIVAHFTSHEPSAAAAT